MAVCQVIYLKRSQLTLILLVCVNINCVGNVVQESLGFDNVREFCDGLPSQNKMAKMGTVSLGLYPTYQQALRGCMLPLGWKLPSVLGLMRYTYIMCKPA